MDQLAFACPGCSARIKYPPSKAGAKVACPRCKAPFQLPPPQADAFLTAVAPDIEAAADAPEVPERWDPKPVAYETPKQDRETYWALRAIVLLLRAAGVLLLAVGMLFGVFLLRSLSISSISPMEIGIFVGIFIWVIQLFGAAELVMLFIGLARNSKQQTELLSRLASRNPG